MLNANVRDTLGRISRLKSFARVIRLHYTERSVLDSDRRTSTMTFSPPTGFRGAFRADDDARAVYAESAGIARIWPRAVAVPVDVEDLSVCPIEETGSDLNWAISCGIGGSDKTAASKAALYVQEEMRRSYALASDNLT